MVGLVVVSHSARLAEGVCELAAQIAQGKVRVAAAGGTTDPDHPLGTDAFRVLEAIESVYSEDGVAVLMDLGSAVLSAETALELLDPDRRARVRLCAAPLVEGTVAAVAQAAAGAGIDEIVEEAECALAGKAAHLGTGGAVVTGPAQPAGAECIEEASVELPNRFGLHARPAAQLIRMARRFESRITIENLSADAGPVAISGISGVLALGARQGHQLRIRAYGRDSGQAVNELASFVRAGCGDLGGRPDAVSGTPQAGPAVPAAPGELAGIPASAGIVIGPLAKLRVTSGAVSVRQAADAEKERQRLRAAVRAAQEETRGLYEWAKAHAGQNEAGIFDAQALFLEDPELIEMAERLIGGGASAEFAWQTAAAHFAARLGALEDEYLRARAADVADVAARVLWRLDPAAAARAAELGRASVVAAEDITPSEIRALDPHLVLGLCLERSSATAHSAILARAMGIPAIVGLGTGISVIADGTTVALDGERGIVCISPDAEEVRAFESRRAAWLAARQTAQAQRHAPALTRDGRRVRVFANLSGIAETVEAIECGAEGVGVLRTEFLFLGRSEAPGEEEQLAAYLNIGDALGGRPLCIRTLDIGGDKSLPYVEIGEEMNPFLGWRGIRVSLGRQDLLRTQLRAILRAGARHPVEILFPMIATLAELRGAKAVVREAEAELARSGTPFQRNCLLGVMVEVPSAVAVADQLAREATFFSIGTNDLTQYVLAADRTNARVAALADPFQPAVLRMVAQAVEAGRRAGIRVTLCGELAANPLATPLLLGLGLEEFSVSAPLIPDLKSAIARAALPRAEALAREALALDTGESVRRLLSRSEC